MLQYTKTLIEKGVVSGLGHVIGGVHASSEHCDYLECDHVCDIKVLLADIKNLRHCGHIVIIVEAPSIHTSAVPRVKGVSTVQYCAHHLATANVRRLLAQVTGGVVVVDREDIDGQDVGVVARWIPKRERAPRPFIRRGMANHRSRVGI